MRQDDESEGWDLVSNTQSFGILFMDFFCILIFKMLH